MYHIILIITIAQLLSLTLTQASYVNPSIQSHIHDSLYSHRPLSPIHSLYSSQWCIGGKGRSGTAAERSCLFHNLCYNTDTKQYVYYRNSSERNHAILADHGYIINKFTADDQHITTKTNSYLQLSVKSWYEPDNVYMTPVIVDSSIPKSNVEWLGTPDDITVIHHSINTHNTGQYLLDTLFVQYILMSSFGVLTSNMQPIYTSSCQQQYTKPEQIQLCMNSIQQYTSGLTSRQPIFISQIKSTVLQCYSQVLVGSGPFGLQSSWGRGSIYRSFRHYYLSNLGFNSDLSTSSTNQPIIAILSFGKLRYNKLTNAAALRQHLHQHIKGSQVQLIDMTSYNTLSDYIKFLQSTHIIIQPAGSIGLTGILMNENSCVINIDTYDINKKKSYGTEERLWSSLGYLHTYNYPVLKNEIQLPAGNANQLNNNEWREAGEITIELDRMVTIVQAALDKMHNFAVV